MQDTSCLYYLYFSNVLIWTWLAVEAIGEDHVPCASLLTILLSWSKTVPKGLHAAAVAVSQMEYPEKIQEHSQLAGVRVKCIALLKNLMYRVSLSCLD